MEVRQGGGDRHARTHARHRRHAGQDRGAGWGSRRTRRVRDEKGELSAVLSGWDVEMGRGERSSARAFAPKVKRLA